MNDETMVRTIFTPPLLPLSFTHDAVDAMANPPYYTREMNSSKR